MHLMKFGGIYVLKTNKFFAHPFLSIPSNYLKVHMHDFFGLNWLGQKNIFAPH